MTNVKRVLKAFVQNAVAAAAPSLWKLRRSSLLILMYHRVLPEGHPEREIEQPGMYVSPETLTMHLEILRRHFSLVHLEDWVAAARRGEPIEGMSCAITFDDGWRDNYEFAYPVLQAARAPATIYLVSDMVGSNYSFWPNRLARLLSQPLTGDYLAQMPTALRACIDSVVTPEMLARGLRRHEIDSVIDACKTRLTDSEMLSALEHYTLASSHVRDLMDWEEIREMSRSGLIRFGSHTRRHTRLLAHLPQDTLREEIEGSRAVIDAALDSSTSTFCYPNGDFCEAAVQIAGRCYRAAVTTRAGWNSASSDLFKLARIGMHEDVSRTPAAFASRLAGVG